VSSTLIIARKDALSLVVTPMIYVISSIFLLLSAYFFFMNLASFNREYVRFFESPVRIESQMPGVHSLVLEPYFLSVIFLFVFIIPLLAMRLLAEERSSGTYELLSILPVSACQIVAGKFLAGAAVVAALSLASLCYPLLLLFFAVLEPGVVFSGVLAVFLSGMAFLSISLACASFSDSQFMSALIGIAVLLFLFFLHALSSLSGAQESLIEQLSLYLRVESMISGLISLSGIFFFLTLIGVGLVFSWHLLSRER